jgi:ABC-type transporter Mla MlaB component
MLRITRRPDRALRLEGRLTRDELDVLRETLRASPDACSALDLSGLAFVDDAGVAALVDLSRRGCELRGGSPFVRQLLEEIAS